MPSSGVMRVMNKAELIDAIAASAGLSKADAKRELDGFVRLWTHGTLPSNTNSDPFYNNYASNYSAADYVTINGSGATSGPGTLSVIGGGQGFFVLMNPGVATSSTAIFNNAMRNNIYSNSQFYRERIELVKKLHVIIWIHMLSFF